MDLGPAIIYNVPGRTGQDIPDDIVKGMAGHPNFLGVKECTGNARIEGYAAEGVRCWSGELPLLSQIVTIGGVQSCAAVCVDSFAFCCFLRELLLWRSL